MIELNPGTMKSGDYTHAGIFEIYTSARDPHLVERYDRFTVKPVVLAFNLAAVIDRLRFVIRRREITSCNRRPCAFSMTGADECYEHNETRAEKCRCQFHSSNPLENLFSY